MDPITFTDQMIEIDAGLVAKGLHMDPAALRDAMRGGRVTQTIEKGEGDDAGRYRVTFYAPHRRLRLTFGADGALLQTSSVDYARRPRSAAPDISR